MEDTTQATPPAGLSIPRVFAWAVAWGSMMATSAAWSLLVVFDRNIDQQFVTLVAIYFAGASAAFLPTGPITLRLVRRWPRAWRFAAIAAGLAAATLLFTAGVLALEHRVYFAQWHERPLSRIWFAQQFYTAVGSTYQYAVIGIRHYLPLGPVFLLATSWRLSTKAR